MARAKKRTDADKAAALAATSEADVKQTLDRIGELQATVQGTLAGLGVSMSTKIEELNNLETAIDARKDELKEIHNIEVEADSLDGIKQEIVDVTAHLADVRAEDAKAWKETQAERKQTREREAEEHTYMTVQRNERDMHESADASEVRQREERFRQEDVNKEISDRLEAVGERESKMSELETKVDGIPAAIEEAAATAKEEATKSVGQAFGHEKAMLKKDADAAAQLAAAQLSNLHGDVEGLVARIASLEDQLAQAQRDAKEIATSAVEASSQAQALATLQKSIETQSQAPSRGR